MSVEILPRSQLCCGLSAAQVRKVTEAARHLCYANGQVIFRQDEPGDSMFIVVNGRVKLEVSLSDGQDRLVDYLGVGEHFGEMAMLTGGRRVVTMTAVMDSELLELGQDTFQRLVLTTPRLATNLSRTLGHRLRRETTGERQRAKPHVIGLVSTTPQTQKLLPRVAAALVSEGDSVQVLTDGMQVAANDSSYVVEQIPQELHGLEMSSWLHERLSQLTPHRDHVLVNAGTKTGGADLRAVLSKCEQIWWLVEPASSDPPLDELRTFLETQPKFAPRIHLVWVLREVDGSIPLVSENLGIAQPDFKVFLAERLDAPSRHQRQSLSRLVLNVHGTRIGLALGGGGARGLAHLGVLRALQREGIDFDLISGTSVGALMALPYAYGMELDEAVATFKSALTPGWFFRHIPRGSYWSMLYEFRTGGWDPKLRQQFGDVRLEQLHIPLSTVAVDLVSGRQVVRDRGDAINAVLESINLPGIARPIVRDGMALVDGGIFNNIPGDLLPERGADLVVGIDIAAKLPQRFAGLTRGSETRETRRPGTLETIVRANEVKDHELTALRTKALDLVISVDTSRFDFSDFTKAEELADVGEEAAQRAIPQLKALLAEQKKSESLSSSRFICDPTLNLT